MDIDLSQFRETFLAECVEHIGTMEEGLLSLQSGCGDAEQLHTIFRAAHSVKGAAGTFGWNAIVRLTHAMEDLFDRLRAGRMAVDPALLRLLLHALDEVKAIVAAGMDGNDGSDQAAMELSEAGSQVVARMRELLDGEVGSTSDPESGLPAPAAPALEQDFRISFAPSPGCFAKGVNPLSAIEELACHGLLLNAELDASQLPALNELNPRLCYLGWNLVVRTALDEAELSTAFELIDGEAQVVRIPGDSAGVRHAAHTADTAAGVRKAEEGVRRTATASDAQSIRVPAKKVDQLIDLAGELVIAYSMANDVLANFTPESLPRLKTVIGLMERGTREIQERIMSVRMLPAGTMFQRFPRLVYDIAHKTGKQIAMRIGGEETEIDKTVAEKLIDPLTHLVRNAADHGIESAEERLAAGKPEQGTIWLRSSHQAGKVVIEVADDGRGLDTARIRAKAVAKGLIAPDAALSDTEIQQLIFAAGFSTRDEVSDLSGRGVGMDVVRRNVEALNGVVAMESQLGSGTVVRLRLPLTLAIIDGLLLSAGDQSFALPLSSVLESLRPSKSQLLRVGSKTTLMLRSESVPVVRLAHVFGVSGARRDPTKALLVITECGNSKVALMVDDVIGQQQFVVKSVEKNFRRVEGTLGATILGDGRVALIVDVAALKAMERLVATADEELEVAA